MRNLQNVRISNILLNFYNIFTLVFTASLTNIARPKYIMMAWKIIVLVFIVCTYTFLGIRIILRKPFATQELKIQLTCLSKTP